MTAVVSDPAVVEVQRLLGPDTSRYPGDELDWGRSITWRHCPRCSRLRDGTAELSCLSPDCLDIDTRAEKRADRLAQS